MNRPIHTHARLSVVAFTTVLALLGAACSSGSDTSTPAGSSGDAPTAAAPLQFSAELLSGEPFDAAELEGTDAVLWFWAPWCTSCRAEAPEVMQAASDFRGSVEVIGVPGRGEVGEMEGFVTDTGTDGLRHAVDSDGSIWRDFGIIGQPAFAFVNDDGTVETFVGGLGYEQLTDRMARLSQS